MTPARFRWGMLFILIGLLLLLVNIGVLSSRFWADFFYFIPFLLIAIGLEKIFAGTNLRIISYLTSVALFAVGLWIAVEGSRHSVVAGFFDSETIREKVEPGTSEIRATLDLGKSDLTIRDATGDLVYGRFNEWSYKPLFKYIREDSVATIVLNSPGESRRFWGGIVHIEDTDPDEWHLSFNRDLPLHLECFGEQSDLHLNLSTTPLKDLLVDAADAEMYVKIGDMEPRVVLELKGFDSRLRLRVPRESGLKITGTDDADYLETIGLVPAEDYFVTPGYDTTSARIDANLDDRFRSLSIDFY
jgi:hypothetical protein